MSDDTTNLDSYIKRQRTDFSERRSALVAERDAATRKIDEEIATIERELASLTAYEAMRTGKMPVNSSSVRVRRGSRREDIVRVLTDAPQGLTRSDLLDAMAASGDKTTRASVSNALTIMHNSGVIVRDNNGRWSLAPQELQQSRQEQPQDAQASA